MECTVDGLKKVRDNLDEEIVLRITKLDSKPGSVAGKICVTDGNEVMEAYASFRMANAISSWAIREKSLIKLIDYAFCEIDNKQVTHKERLIEYSPGKFVFSFDVVDIESSEIRVVSFGVVAKSLHSDIIQDKVYIFSGSGGIQPSKSQYTPFKSKWEILASKNMVYNIQPDDVGFPKIVLDRKTILEVSEMEPDTFVDVVGVVTLVGLTNVTCKDSGTLIKRRTLCLGDESGRSIDVCLWDSKAEEEGSKIYEKFERGEKQFLCVKGGKISEYNGRSISVIGASTVLLDVDLEIVASVRAWYSVTLDSTSFIHVTGSSGSNLAVRTTTISEMMGLNLKVMESSDTYRITANIRDIRIDNFSYPACTRVVNGRQCGKKVSSAGEDVWFCISCDSEIQEVDHKYALHVCIEDSSQYVWAIAFQEAARELVGLPAQDFASMRDENYDVFSAHLDAVRSKVYTLKVRCKLESYQDSEKMKFYIVGLDV
ncbi:replication protein A 70 kDa DNA-binding subunit E-like [Selaginella moellendorffii]|uniref:replication protein A 70 kDa DNA-binding subunit E-like n=1 Tax=Selaginella moellendorffii TaxID=88036 RepID=UPI000D1C37DC|nr:replication protein A 70 kDa DNA-binding subunit E-like [Selaginella moellendorffii]|eukprot:XP_024532784.1 replication protein A 70 kDa DNA-binding subunit E-like [Selaginella moellendorffii]